MKKTRIFSLVLCLAAAAMLLTSCKERESEPQVRSYFDWFDTFSTVYSYANDSPEAFAANCKGVAAILEEYDKLFDIYDMHEGVNNLCVVNRTAGREPVKVDPRLLDFLEYAKELYTLTNGEMNIAMGAVLKLWHDCRTEANDGGEKRLPDEAELAEAAKHTDINSIVINREEGTVYFTDPMLRIDVGAVGKGYTVEKAAEALIAAGVDGYVLNVGGNVRCIGTRPSGKGWSTGITNPDKESGEPFVCRVELKNVSCVTSGNYERYYEVDGVRYHHVIDKDTLMPAEYFSLVTVITEDSGLADALTTALFCMSHEDGLRLIDGIDGISGVLWVTASGERLTTPGFDKMIIEK
ncbi:MAG: FAD:protein FMN transferase [Clostridia bacterium]|nr:FAD:protein FMN transferase [Clostridia bacterium]